MMDYKRCSELTCDRKLVLKDKGGHSEFIVNNKTRQCLEKVRVDGCLIGDNERKCDWLVLTTQAPLRALYVELKGCRLLDAVCQLENTLKLTKQPFGQYQRECYAVTRRVPKLDSNIRKIKLDFVKNHQATFQVKNIKMAVDV